MFVEFDREERIRRDRWVEAYGVLRAQIEMFLEGHIKRAELRRGLERAERVRTGEIRPGE
jgi:hypothetical protein